MQIEVKFAGFGGQGIMIAGKLLALTGMEEGKEVVWIPSYGPEMRGGTAYCTVVIADRPIGSPVVNNPQNMVVMNRPSLEKFGPTIKPNGLIISNSSLIPITSGRNDLTEVRVPCNQIAIDVGNTKGANMVALGAYVACSQVVSMKVVEKIVKQEFAKKPKFIDANLEALQRGADAARADMEKTK
jgi:2-oxoglutarate ferredoxin oxidoreductase subunit gamma